jgi:hypothetical protein
VSDLFDKPLKPTRGRLKAAPWSDIPITDELKKKLRDEAAENCLWCRGLGYTPGTKGGYLAPCVCVNRKETT